MQSFICWFTGTGNRYQVTAATRKEAMAEFAKRHGVTPSAFIQCRKAKADYCLLECGVYGIAH